MRSLRKTCPLGMLILVLVLACLGSVNGRTCEPRQFWSSFFDKCMNCTECAHPDITLTPCQGHRDTICGPLSELKIDWSWMMKHSSQNSRPVKEMTETFKENMQEIKLHEMHKKQREKLLRKMQQSKPAKSSTSEEDTLNDDILKSNSNKELWDKLKAFGKERDGATTGEMVKSLSKPKFISEDPNIFEIPYGTKSWNQLHFNSDEARELLKSASRESDEPTSENSLKFETPVKNFGFFPVEDETESPEDDAEEDDDEDEDDPEEVSAQEMDFSTTERVILDYQTGILYLAVGSVIFFFGVALCYSLKHLRTWGGRNYAQDLEELQFWLTKKDQKKPMTSTIYKTTTEVVSKNAKGHCKYLERIISKNAKKKMNRVPENVYQGPHPCMETRPLTAPMDDPEVHKPIPL